MTITLEEYYALDVAAMLPSDRISPGLYRATSPHGDSIELIVERRDGVLRGSTAESADRRRRGYSEGPGVAVVDLIGWRLERLGGLP